MLRKDGRVVWMEARGQTLDVTAPQKLAVWSYRPFAAEQIGGDDGLYSGREAGCRVSCERVHQQGNRNIDRLLSTHGRSAPRQHDSEIEGQK